MRKTFGVSCIGKRKTKSSVKVFHSSPPTNRPVPSQSLNSDLFGKIIKNTFIAQYYTMWNGICLWSVGFSCPGCTPPNFLPTLSLLHGGAEWGTEKASMLSNCRKIWYTINTSLVNLHHSTIWKKLPQWKKLNPIHTKYVPILLYSFSLDLYTWLKTPWAFSPPGWIAPAISTFPHLRYALVH